MVSIPVNILLNSHGSKPVAEGDVTAAAATAAAAAAAAAADDGDDVCRPCLPLGQPECNHLLLTPLPPIP